MQSIGQLFKNKRTKSETNEISVTEAFSMLLDGNTVYVKRRINSETGNTTNVVWVGIRMHFSSKGDYTGLQEVVDPANGGDYDWKQTELFLNDFQNMSKLYRKRGYNYCITNT